MGRVIEFVVLDRKTGFISVKQTPTHEVISPSSAGFCRHCGGTPSVLRALCLGFRRVWGSRLNPCTVSSPEYLVFLLAMGCLPNSNSGPWGGVRSPPSKLSQLK